MILAEVNQFSDDDVLQMVRLRSAGVRCVEIARRFGCASQYVSTATNRVKRDDARCSGEDVSGEYWPE
jgi:transposase-like protein